MTCGLSVLMNFGLRSFVGVIRPRGLLAKEPKASALHKLLEAILAWLGFYLCGQFAQLMNGTIEVESAPGEGSRFRLKSSAEVVDEVEAGDPPDPAQPQTPATGKDPAEGPQPGLSGIAQLPAGLKAPLLNAVLHLENECIHDAVRSVSEVDHAVYRRVDATCRGTPVYLQSARDPKRGLW